MAKKSAKKSKSGHRKNKPLKSAPVNKPVSDGVPGLVTATRSTAVKYDDLGVRKILSDYTAEHYGVVVNENSWEMSTDEDDNFITSVSAVVVVKVNPQSPTGLEGEEEAEADDEDSETDEEPDDEGS